MDFFIINTILFIALLLALSIEAYHTNTYDTYITTLITHYRDLNDYSLSPWLDSNKAQIWYEELYKMLDAQQSEPSYLVHQ